MARLPIIRRISSRKGLGVFKNYTDCGDIPELRQYNLIYGFNGTGKTTLSRVLACLEAGRLLSELPADGKFEIELSDGRMIKTAEALDALKGRLLVFNTDFIEQNLRWKEGTANPVFYLGKEQADRAKALEEANTQITALQSKRGEAPREHTRSDKVFVEYKRDTARLIADQLGMGRKYDATNLASDYGRRSYDDECLLTDEGCQDQRHIILQEEPLAKRSLLDAGALHVIRTVQDARSILVKTVGSLMASDLQEHDVMLKWLKEGVDYHEEHNLSTCLFCGNELTSERRATLATVIDEKFDELVTDIDRIERGTTELRRSIVTLKASVPSVNDVSKDLHTRYGKASADLHSSITGVDNLLAAIHGKLELKAKTPNISIDVSDLLSDDQVDALIGEADNNVSMLNDILREHNKAYDEFNQVQDAARVKLKEHYLAEKQARYHELKSNAAVAKSELESVDCGLSSRRREVETIKQEMRQHGHAAELISRMIQSYLGHKEIAIGTRDEGYEFLRKGKPISGHLSEGEKTAIALCYFLSTLEAEGRKRKELIVVIDDPISSLDTRALHYAFSMLKSALSGVAPQASPHFSNDPKDGADSFVFGNEVLEALH